MAFFIAIIAAPLVAADAITRRYLTDKYCGAGLVEEYAFVHCAGGTVGCYNKLSFEPVETEDAATYCSRENYEAVKKDCEANGGEFFGFRDKKYDAKLLEKTKEFYYWCARAAEVTPDDSDKPDDADVSAAPAGSADSKGKKAGVDSAAKAEAEREFRQNIDKLIDEFNKQAVKLNGG